jgi:DNA-binding SARP family transcriptional activator/TolB-like protein
MFRLRTFGGLSIEGGDGPLGGPTAQRRPLALLALLALARDRGVSRDKLVGYLWPESDEEKARHVLAQVLYRLRRELGASAIVTDGAVLRLDPAALIVDATEFEDALQQGELERAHGLYAGPFLDGFFIMGAPEFERWASTERDRLAQRHRDTLETLAQRAAARADFVVAAEWWRQLAALEPLNARYARAFMEALAAAGDRAGALQHARLHEMLLQQELDVPLDPGVAALAARLRGDNDDTRPPGYSEGTPIEPALPGARPEDAVPVLDAPSLPAPAPARATPRPAPTPRASRRLIHRTVWVGLAMLAAVIAMGVAMMHPPLGDAPVLMAVGSISDYTAGDSSGLADALPDMLTTNLGRVPELHMLSRAQLYTALAQLKLDHQDDAAFARAARQAGVKELIDGAIYRRADGRLRLDVRRLDLETGTVREAYRAEGSDVFALVDSITARLATSMGARLPGTLRIADVSTNSLVAYHFYEKGLRALYQADQSGAIRFFSAALDVDSTFGMAAYYAYRTTGDRAYLERAMRLTDRVSERERLLIRAEWAASMDDPSRLAWAESLTVRFPLETDGYVMLGKARLWSGDFLGALAPLRKVITMDSLSFAAGDERCRACEALGSIITAYEFADSLPAAERVAREWTRRSPGSSAAWKALADNLDKQGRLREAAAVRQQVVALDPGIRDNFIATAQTAIHGGDFERADALLHEMIRSGTDLQQRDGLWYLDISLRYQGRLTEALAVARRYRALARTAGLPGAYEAYPEVQVLFEMGRFRDAAALCDTIARAVDSSATASRRARSRIWALTHEASALAAAGDTSAITAIADTLEALAPLSGYGRDRRLYHHARGLLFEARGRPTEAARELRLAIFSTTTGYTRTNLELARILIDLHRPREAVPLLRAALRGGLDASNMYVTYTEIYDLLGRAFEGAAMPDSAAAYDRMVVDAWRNADPAFAGRRAATAQRLAWLEARMQAPGQ